MSIVKNSSPSIGELQVKLPWVTPSIQILEMKAARSGTILNGKDGLSRS
jgi:hypothetical protein